MAQVKAHTPGRVRFITYYLIFPGDMDVWVDQTPFVHELSFQLKQTRWRHEPNKLNELMKKGETTWKDNNGVTHRVVIEETERPRKWGTRKKAS